MDELTHDIEEALVAHWSYLGRWSRGRLVDEAGILRYETPIPHLPYNGVIRTLLEVDPDCGIGAVVESFARRGVSFVWWVHPSCGPTDLARRLEAHGLVAAEHVAGMSIELENWNPERPGPAVSYDEVIDESGMSAYEDLIVTYWELPTESQAMVSDLNRSWGPGKFPGHRWLAKADGKPVGKALLSLTGPPGVAAIYGMSVKPEARGRGVAGGLTTTLLQRAKDIGCHRVVLHSSAMAVDVYRRAGFVEQCSLTVYANAPLWSSRHH